VNLSPPAGRAAAREGRAPIRALPACTFAAAAAALLLGAVHAQTSTRLLLERAASTIEIVNEGRSDQGARSILDLAGCVPGEDVRSNFFYAPEGGVTARIVGENESAEPTVVEAPLVIVRRPEAADDGASDEGPSGEGASSEGDADVETPADEESLEALDAEVRFGRPPCLEEVTTPAEPRVALRQGRSTATGSRFFLDRGTDAADLEGPVTLVRTPQGDGPTVEAEASSLRFDLDAGRSTLTGDVRVTAGDRTSEASALELDEEAGVAILTGDPAVSRLGEDEVRGSRLLYDLETNDVVVEGAVEATFEVEDAEAPAALTGDGNDEERTPAP
jgi:lipopolysaccharide export system protein LptA